MGGGTEPLIVTVVNGILDKTFGEIRQAHKSGRVVMLKWYDNEQNGRYSLVLEIDWDVNGNYHDGRVLPYNGNYYTARLTEPPYTIEALDAIYPVCDDD